MRSKVIIVLLICTTWVTASYARKAPAVSDSVLLEYAIAMEGWTYKNLDSTKKYACLILDNVSPENDPYYYGAAYTGLGYVHMYKNKLNQALSYFKASYGYVQSLGDSSTLSNAYMDFGNIYTELGNYRKGLEYFLLAEHYIPNDPYWKYYSLAYNNYNIAETFLDLSDYSNCTKYLEKAEANALKDTSVDLQHAIKNMRAELLLRNEKLDEAQQYVQLALRQGKEVQDYMEQARSLEILAKIYAKKGFHTKAVELQNEALETATIFGDQTQITEQQTALAERLLDKGDANSAYPFIQKAYDYASGTQSLMLIQKTSEVLAKVLESSGRYKEAISAFKTFQAINDSISKINLYESLLVSEREVSLQKNALLQTRMALQKQMLHQNKMMLLGIVIALILSLTFIVILIINGRRRYRAQQQVVEKQKLINQQSELLKKTNQDLVELNSNKDKLFSVITHDLKQPFNQTLSLLEILKAYKIDDDDLETLVDQVYDATQETKDTVDNLLIWSKSQFANIKSNPGPVDVTVLANQMLREFKVSMAQKHISGKLTTDKDAIAFVDPNHLEIILRNLLQNAIKFSEYDSTIEIFSHKNDSVLTLGIKDEGRGMSADQIEMLFDVNSHFSTPGTLNEKGTGLGMLIVKEYVKENKGTIYVESAPGKGSTFKINLPLA